MFCFIGSKKMNLVLELAEIEKQVSALISENINLKKENKELTEQNTSFLTSVENLNKSVQELEAEVKEWKDKADLWCKTANLKDHNIMINKELEKENAELKKACDETQELLDKQIEATYKLDKENAELKSRECWKSCEYANPKSELIAQHIKDVQQLTKAKEFLNEFMRISKASDEDFEHDYSELIGEAEQFLKEVEK